MDSKRRSLRWQQQILVVLLAGTGVVVFASLMMSMLGVSYTSPIREFFDVSDERNLPTWWNSGLLLVAAVSTLSIGLARNRASVDRRFGWVPWVGLAAILALMALDEFSGFHEMLGLVWEKVFGENPLTSFGWFVLGVPLAIGVLLFLWLCARQLPRATARWYLLGMGTLLFGAIVLEAGPLFMDFGRNSIAYYLTYHAEELLEMIGASILAVAPLRSIDAVRISGGYTVEFIQRESRRAAA